MPKYLVIENEIAVNSIIADSVEIATTLTGRVCVEVEHEIGQPDIGWSYIGNKFVAPSKPEMEIPIPITE
jgi:hypothetical protein